MGERDKRTDAHGSQGGGENRVGEIARGLPDHPRHQPEGQRREGGQAGVAPEAAGGEVRAAIHPEEARVLEHGQAQDPDPERPKDTVL